MCVVVFAQQAMLFVLLAILVLSQQEVVQHRQEMLEIRVRPEGDGEVGGVELVAVVVDCCSKGQWDE